MTLVVLRGLIRGSTAEQLRVHNEPDIDGALPPPVPWRHLVLKKERQMWATGESRRGRGCSFSRRFKLSGQFQLSGAKGSPLDKSGSSDAPRVPSDVTKREKDKDKEGKGERERVIRSKKRERERDSESGAYSRLFLIKTWRSTISIQLQRFTTRHTRTLFLFKTRPSLIRSLRTL